MKQTRNVIALTVALAALSLEAQAGPPYNVDDPATTEKGRNNLQIVYTYLKAPGSEVQTFPALSLAHGVNDRLEIGLAMNGISVRNEGMPHIYGFGDTALAVRWRFRDETKYHPQALIGYSLSLPTGSQDHTTGAGAVTHSLWLSGGKTFRRWFLYGNVGMNFMPQSSGNQNAYYGLGLTYQVNEKLTLGASLAGNTPAADGLTQELNWGLGFTYLYKPDQTYMFRVGRSMRGNGDLMLFAGYSLVFK